MKLICKLFGHKWRFNPMDDIRPYCARCWIEETSLDKELDQRIKSWNCSDLDSLRTCSRRNENEHNM